MAWNIRSTRGLCCKGFRPCCVEGSHWEDGFLFVFRLTLSICSQKPSRRGIFLQKTLGMMDKWLSLWDMDTHTWCVRSGVSPPKREKMESRSLCAQTWALGSQRLCPAWGQTSNGRTYEWEGSTASGLISAGVCSTRPSLSSLIAFSSPSLQMKVLHCSSLIRWGNTIHEFVWHFTGNSQKHLGN